MIIQENNKQLRQLIEKHSIDKEYLLRFFESENVFPLFSQVLIETRTDCNNKCSFCPQTHYNKPFQEMEWECFTRIIEYLKVIEFSGRVALLLSNEPLLDTRLINMIQYIKSQSSRLFVDITTNGKLLNLDFLDALMNAGLDNININDYRSDRDFNPNSVSSNIIPILKAYSNNPKVSYNSRRTDEILPNYAGVITQEFDKESYGFCNFPFRKLVISVSGEILVCCNDFTNYTSMGNIYVEDLISIWNSNKFNEYRFNLLNDKRMGLCESCNDVQDYSIYEMKNVK